jgi:hypothetical protein
MKKFIAVAAILSVMFLGAGTSQALMSMPDAVPGKNILIPFFLVSMTDSGGSDNTLITITDVGGVGIGTEVGDAKTLHLNLMDINSVVRLDRPIKMTKYDVYVTDAKSLVSGMSTDNQAALEIDLDNNGINDHWAGYIFVENMVGSAAGNDFMAHVYQVSVLDGLVAGYTGVSLEHMAGGSGHTNLIGAYTDTTLQLQDVEALSANGLYAAMQLLDGVLTADVSEAQSFRLIPRYYIHDTDSTNVLIIWTDEYDDNGDLDTKDAEDIALPGDLHINFYDEHEVCISSTITIDRELNFIHIVNVVPQGLLGTDPYAAGWIDIVTPDILGNGWGNPGDPAYSGKNRYWLGYSLQRAMMADDTTLDVVFEAHRDAAGTYDPLVE